MNIHTDAYSECTPPIYLRHLPNQVMSELFNSFQKYIIKTFLIAQI